MPERVSFDDLITDLARRSGQERTVAGIVGPPGAGKSTVATRIHAALSVPSVVVPMDGFHLATAVLRHQGTADVKGSPQTFDTGGFVSLLRRLRAQAEAGDERTIYAPAFDRDLEESIAGSIEIAATDRLVIVEGNYLLLADGPWEPIIELLDVSVYVDVDPVLRRDRLIDRHVSHGRERAAAVAWVDRSDEPNAALVARTRHRADMALVL